MATSNLKITHSPTLGFLLFLLFLAVFAVSCSSSRPAAPVKSGANISPTAKANAPSGEQEGLLPDSLQPDTQLPVDPQVRKGKLDNGLTYYIRRNKRPENRAELRLAVNAGSILEDSSQQGLAHFTEHMAFNGTKRFKKQELLDYLESFGMRLGPDLNAYTSFDETIYMLQVPTDSLPLLKTGIDVLREWTTNLAFEDEEIDKERGVIIEEWRLGRGANARIRDKQLPILLKGSRYAKRLPIGKVDILKNFKHEVLRNFYHDWYRPELMAVIAVGDFDPVEMENYIKQKFSDIPASRNARPRKTYSVPDHSETRFAIASDPEAAMSTIGIVYQQEKEPEGTLQAYRKHLVESLYNGMFNQRLSELIHSTNPPFIFAGSGKGSFVREKDFYNLNAMVAEGGFERAFEVLLTEAERVKRFGFTRSEFERQKTELLRQMKQAYQERDKSESRQFAAEYIRNYLTNEPIPGIAMEYRLTRKLLPTIQLAEVNRLASEWITDTNRTVDASGPEKEGAPLPTKEQLLAIFDRVAAKKITPYQEKVSDSPLLAKIPQPAKIVAEHAIDSLGVTRLTLSNGVKVVLKPTDFKNDEILFGAQSPGGTSLVPDSEFVPATFASTLIGQSGVGKFGPIELRKKLSGKVVRVFPAISSLNEGLRGSASPQDVETLFQLVYLYFTEPRADSITFISYQKRLGDYIRNLKLDPESAFRDTLQVTLAQHHYRSRPLDEKMLDEMDLTKSFGFYRNRFADASDFTFYLVGNFEVEKIKPLIATYLGNLPAIHRVESWKDVGIRPPKGVVEKEVDRGMEPKSQVKIVFTGAFEWSQRNRRLIRAMADVLQLKLREVLREDMGGTYGVGCSASPSHFPYQGYRFSIGFGCDPQRVEELTKAVFVQIDSLKNFGTTEKYLTKVREKSIRQHEKNLKENGYWIRSLQFYDRHGENPGAILKGADVFMKSLSSQMIQAAAKQYLNEQNYVKVVLKPEKGSE